jgi:hypothetical protein
MQLKGKVVQVLATETGEGKNGTWKSQKVIVETGEGQYVKKVCIKLLKDTVDTVWEGDERTFNINIESREYNGKWFNDISCWKIE